MKVYIGYDKNEVEAYRVAQTSLFAQSKILPEPLKVDRLASNGLLRRAVDNRGNPYDIPSNAYCSTEFAVSRFLVPIICQNGWALFTDCDVVFLRDVFQLVRLAKKDKAVYCVKHKHRGDEGQKMGGLSQTPYFRKNWSSVMLFNCDHPANRRLTIQDVNERPGRDLHAFYWLNDEEIGELPMEWNWLVNVEEKPEHPGIAHFTLGGPWIENWEPQHHDNIWNEYAGRT